MHVFGRWEEARVPGENPRILHTVRPQAGIEPGTLSLRGNGANHHTTVQVLLRKRQKNVKNE